LGCFARFLGVVADKGQSVVGSLPINGAVPVRRLATALSIMRRDARLHTGSLDTLRQGLRRIMYWGHGIWRVIGTACLLLVVCAAGGCHAIVHRPEPRLVGVQTPPPIGQSVPTEKDKSSLPAYRVEPPDILFIESLRVVPKPPYHIQSGDELQIIAEPPEANLSARGFFVDPQGRIDMGPRYGKVQLAGLTTDEAAVRKAVGAIYRDPEVSLTLVQSAAMQPITGEHLVSPDGTVNLGTYGLVYVGSKWSSSISASCWTNRRSRCRCLPTTARSTT